MDHDKDREIIYQLEGQSRLNLGKTNYISCQLKMELDGEKQRQK